MWECVERDWKGNGNWNGLACGHTIPTLVKMGNQFFVVAPMAPLVPIIFFSLKRSHRAKWKKLKGIIS
jgi:hypothetical protein